MTAAERRLHAWELRKKGWTYRQIATKLGISHGQVSKIIKSQLDEMRTKTHELIDDVIKLEEERLDTMFAAVWTKASLGDPDSVSAALRIMDRRAKLRGLDAPTKQVKEAEVPMTDAELLELADRYGVKLDPKLRQSMTVKPEVTSGNIERSGDVGSGSDPRGSEFGKAGHTAEIVNSTEH